MTREEKATEWINDTIWGHPTDLEGEWMVKWLTRAYLAGDEESSNTK